MVAEEITTCPIWGNAYKAKGTYDPEEKVYYVTESERAFADYIIDEGLVENFVSRMSDTQKAQLTTWLVDQWIQFNYEPEITFRVLSEVGGKEPLPVHVRADRLLKFMSMSRRFSHLGEYVGFTQHYCYELAWSESTHLRDVRYLLDYLEKNGWIERDPYGSQFGQDVNWRVSVEGHRRVDELEREEKASNSSQAFVAMWFDSSMDEAYERGIKPAIENAGYEPFKINDKPDVDKIDDEIIGEIRRSRFLVADFTHGEKGARGGVYYEAGFAYGLGLHVVRSCHKKTVDANELHFDVRQHYHVVWETVDELRDGLEKRIRAVVGEGPNVRR